MGRSAVAVSTLCLFLSASGLMADMWRMEIEFVNGSKSEGWLTDLNFCEGEFHWSDNITRPYWSGTGSSAKPVWPILKLAQVRKLEFAPLTVAERQRIGTGKLPRELVKATVTFVDGEVRKDMYLELKTGWQTAKETGDFIRPVARIKSIALETVCKQ